MKRHLHKIGFLIAVLLAGVLGFAATSEWLPPSRSAAVQVDVDLSATTEPQVAEASAPESTDKLHETEPEELPSIGDIEIEIVRRDREHGTPLRVLIYHTHTFEAFEPDFNGQYKATERWRTKNNEYNVVRLGAELAALLRGQYGMTVVHDDTPFELPKLNSAYQRSLEAIENYTARGETFDLYIDLHRDAYIEGVFKKNTVSVDGAEIARIMFLIGKGTGTYQGQAFAQQPDWEANCTRAEMITEAINELAPKLCRPVSIKDSRYNQHVSAGAMLVEIGNNMNTLDEALRAVPYLAQAIAETTGGTVTGIQHPVDGQ